jgi:hypothetical protein
MAPLRWRTTTGGSRYVSTKVSYRPDGPTCSNDVMQIVRELGCDTGQLEYLAVGVVVGRLGWICSVGTPHLYDDPQLINPLSSDRMCVAGDHRIIILSYDEI